MVFNINIDYLNDLKTKSLSTVNILLQERLSLEDERINLGKKIIKLQEQLKEVEKNLLEKDKQYWIANGNLGTVSDIIFDLENSASP